MARQKTKKTNSPLPLILIALAVLVLAVGAGAFYFFNSSDEEIAETAQQCVPAQVSSILGINGAVKAAPAKINIYFDGSGGMAGYVSPSLGSANAIGNLISATRNFTQSGLYQNGQGEIVFRSFGTKVSDPIAQPESFARPAAYRCPQGGCDNQETRIDTLLRHINAERRQGNAARTELNIIVTDLMLDNKDAVDSFEASVGGQLRTAVIEENLAVGIMGVRTGFNGNIYHEGRRFNAKVRRPLVLLMIGQPKHVRAYRDYLQTSEIPGFSKTSADQGDMAFALFGQEAGAMQLTEPQVRKTGSGFAKTRVTKDERLLALFGNLPQFGARKSDAAGGEGAGLAMRLAANANVADYEITGNKPRYTSSVWRLNANMADNAACAPNALWSKTAALPSDGWIVEGQDVGYLLTMDRLDTSSMRSKGTYLVQLVAGQSGLAVPHEAAAWMDDWAMAPEQITSNLTSGKPGIGAPGLSRLRRILETELDTKGRDSIPRSATHFILRVE
ncbi:hypothetical protein [Sphingorhabdus sp. Alg239-R122]|uniref:hypothetical protein n=1 Tax=Sphingorhabdus sp. Alg239-R122 TaxID=2305989 RepID=UPI0013D92B01|nr:hypothetical protein [Sphingorhabdus sp. Alg239-R122]